ncbi:hypothetical protein CBL_02965 [Carabus blaptoides fortunei]
MSNACTAKEGPQQIQSEIGYRYTMPYQSNVKCIIPGTSKNVSFIIVGEVLMLVLCIRTCSEFKLIKRIQELTAESDIFKGLAGIPPSVLQTSQPIPSLMLPMGKSQLSEEKKLGQDTQQLLEDSEQWLEDRQLSEDNKEINFYDPAT